MQPDGETEKQADDDNPKTVNKKQGSSKKTNERIRTKTDQLQQKRHKR